MSLAYANLQEIRYTMQNSARDFQNDTLRLICLVFKGKELNDEVLKK